MKQRSIAILVMVLMAVSVFSQGIDHYNLALTFEGQKNWTKAFDQMLMAAEGGNSEAQFRVANYYLDGRGTPSDRAKAIEWWERAAVSGNDSAAIHLAEAYSLWSNYRDVNKAKRWIVEAAKHKSKETLLLLGDCSQSIDMRQAMDYYSEAVDSGVAEAALRISNILISPWAFDGTQNEFVDTLKSISWCKTSAEMGCAEAQYVYSQCFATNKYGMFDKEKEQYWYVKSAENGYAEAQYLIAQMYWKGEYFFQKDYEKSLYWLQRAAANGYTAAIYRMGWYAETQENDTAKAAYYYELAAQDGEVNAIYKIGKAYRDGLGVKQDYQKAFYWFGKGAAKNNVNCMYNYGALMLYGDAFGVSIDLVQAEKYLTLAAAAGHPEAIEDLKLLNSLKSYYNDHKEEIDKAVERQNKHKK